MLPAEGQGSGPESVEGEATPNPHPWPLAGRDPQGTRSSPADTSGNQGKLKWRFKTDSQVHSSPIIGADGTVYLQSVDLTLYAISPPTTGTEGVLKWRFVGARMPEVNGDWMRSPALGADGTVYLSSDKLYAVAPPDSGTEGILKWSYQVPNLDTEDFHWPTVGAPGIGADGTIYVVGSQLCALSPVPKAGRGVLKWSYDHVLGGEEPPAISLAGTVYVQSISAGLVGIDPPTRGNLGSLRWSLPSDLAAVAPPIAEEGTVYGYQAEGYNVVSAITPAAGGEIKVDWTFRTDCAPDYQLGAIGADGTVYVACNDGDLLALAKTKAGNLGVLKWRWFHPETHGVLSSPAVGADGTVFVGGNDGRIYAISPPKIGTLAITKWAFRTLGPVYSSPAIGADGTVYAASVDSYLYALE
jgi:outer membrane protein assembly factor BamB